MTLERINELRQVWQDLGRSGTLAERMAAYDKMVSAVVEYQKERIK